MNLDGNYLLDGASDVIIEDSKLITKDSFWNTKNVYVKNSEITGEYIGWNSENITFENCTIDSIQAFCYMKNVKLINCTLYNTNLAFEFSTVDATVNNEIESVKNPISGRIEALRIKELILDELLIDKDKTIIKVKE